MHSEQPRAAKKPVSGQPQASAPASAESEDVLCCELARADAAEALERVLPAIRARITRKGQWRACKAAGRAGARRALEVLFAAFGPDSREAAAQGAIRAGDAPLLEHCLAPGAGVAQLCWRRAGRGAAKAGALPILQALERLLPPATSAEYRVISRCAARWGHAEFARYCLERVPDAAATACFAAYGGHWALAAELRADDGALGPHLLAYAAAGGQLAIVRHLHEEEGVPLVGAAESAAGIYAFQIAHFMRRGEHSGSGWKYHRARESHPAQTHATVLEYCREKGGIDADRLLYAGIRSACVRAVQIAFDAGARFGSLLNHTSAAGVEGLERALQLFRPQCAACLVEAAGEFGSSLEHGLADAIRGYLRVEFGPAGSYRAACTCGGDDGTGSGEDSGGENDETEDPEDVHGAEDPEEAGCSETGAGSGRGREGGEPEGGKGAPPAAHHSRLPWVFRGALALIPAGYPGRARCEAALAAAAESRQGMGIGGATFATPMPLRQLEARLALEAAFAAHPPPPGAAWPDAALRRLGDE